MGRDLGHLRRYHHHACGSRTPGGIAARGRKDKYQLSTWATELRCVAGISEPARFPILPGETITAWLVFLPGFRARRSLAPTDRPRSARWCTRTLDDAMSDRVDVRRQYRRLRHLSQHVDQASGKFVGRRRSAWLFRTPPIDAFWFAAAMLGTRSNRSGCVFRSLGRDVATRRGGWMVTCPGRTAVGASHRRMILSVPCVAILSNGIACGVSRASFATTAHGTGRSATRATIGVSSARRPSRRFSRRKNSLPARDDCGRRGEVVGALRCELAAACSAGR